uniref:Ubiquitin-associated protein 2-like n=1 Tax=Petromyzon marinus TaxID=7757 RepID=A0AAJ7WKN2_PETMA
MTSSQGSNAIGQAGMLTSQGSNAIGQQGMSADSRTAYQTARGSPQNDMSQTAYGSVRTGTSHDGKVESQSLLVSMGASLAPNAAAELASHTSALSSHSSAGIMAAAAASGLHISSPALCSTAPAVNTQPVVPEPLYGSHPGVGMSGGLGCGPSPATAFSSSSASSSSASSSSTLGPSQHPALNSSSTASISSSVNSSSSCSSSSSSSAAVSAVNSSLSSAGRQPAAATSGKAPPNLPPGVPPMLPNQYIMGPGGLLPAYPPQIYGYDELQMIQARMPIDYYGMAFTPMLSSREATLPGSSYTGERQPVVR